MTEQIKHEPNHNRRLLKKLVFIGMDTILTMLAFWLTDSFIVTISTHRITVRFPFSEGDLLLMWLAAGALSIPIYIAFGFYRPLWRFASIPQYLTLAFGTLAYTGFVVIASVFSKMPQNPAFYAIFWMILLLAVVFYRLFFRVIVNRRSQRSLMQAVPYRHNRPAEQIRVMVIGAGYAGNQIIREMIQTRGHHLPVVLIDDDPNKQGLFISRVPVIGGRDRILSAVNEYAIDEIILAIPSATRQTVRELVDICHQTDCALRIVPMMSDIISGKISISDIREVEIEDLLGREAIHLDLTEIARYLSGQVVMVTGGGGSIGSELCRQIVKYNPSQLIVFDIYENNAYDLQQELLSQYGHALNLVVLIGSVRDAERLDTVMRTYQPSIIFHAAAHKHVPLMEDSPSEAIKNNVLGTYQTALMAGRHNVKRFVMISTDKAVNPTNVMGASKRLAELTIQYLNRQFPLTTYMAVRFGNVLGSNGSVIPLFKKQIQHERKVTVTDPNVTRYFMTIPEAVSLVIQAGAMAEGGEIFVLDMGEPVKIIDLAKDLIRLSGLEPDTDVEIVYTGMRPGEKMYEELCLDLEQMDSTRHQKIFVMKPVQDRAAIVNEITKLQAIIGWECHALRELLGKVQETLKTCGKPDENKKMGS